MTHFFAWYLLVSIQGWLVFPLVWRLFPALPDRGFTLVRAFGLLLWGYLFWFLASMGVVQNDGGGLFLTFLVMGGMSALAGWKFIRPPAPTLFDWVKNNKRLIITVEIIFLLAFAAWTFVRASNPDIETAGGEKTMELAFINSILRSPTFPPRDPWLSGFSISYYYFGYVMAGILAKVTATPGAVAHNLMLALIFGLSFVGAYGILFNLLAAWKKRKTRGRDKKPNLGIPFLGPLFLLFVSNVAGFLEVLHRLGVGWSGQAGDTNLWTRLGKLVRPNLEAFNFWTWLDILHLRDAPIKPYQLAPDRFIWWWQDSRVVQDYDLVGNFTEVIDEFPAFSYLLGDLHPHVLAMPFGLMAIAFALNLLLGGWKGQTNLRVYRLPVHPLALISGALLLGGLAFLNTWDILYGFALLMGGYVLWRVRDHGWSWKRLTEMLSFGIPLGLLAVLLYLPFYIGFTSQAGGILPNLEYPTRGAHLWVMFGTLLVPLLAFLFHLLRRGKYAVNWWLSIGSGIGFTLLLWGFSWLLALVIQWKMPELTVDYMQVQGFASVAAFFGASLTRRFFFLGGLLTLQAVLLPCIAMLSGVKKPPREEGSSETAIDLRTVASKDANATVSGSPPGIHDFPEAAFVIFMIVIGVVLVLVPEFVYLRDLFGKRMNTIFKFYYQAWIVWSIAAAFGISVMLYELRKTWRWVLGFGLGLLLLVGLAFPIFGMATKTNNFRFTEFSDTLRAVDSIEDPDALLRAVQAAWTLDGARLFHRQYPNDAAAADWLTTADLGVVAEAVGGSYTGYGRISTYSGQATVVGWIGHEDQWRGTFEEQRQRGERDIPVLYQSNNWAEVLAIIENYDIRYIVVGTLERNTYRVNETNFQRHLVQIFQSGNVVIYQVP